MSRLETRDVSSRMLLTLRCVEPRPLDEAHLHAVGARLHVVFGKTPHAAKFAQRIEVSDRRHIRVGGLAEAIEQRLRRREECGVDADQHGRPRAARRANAHIAASRHRSTDR